ncbi:MAG TPA: leucine-rich repeat domain-containing protein, partial [Urbifossiella sp.]|nr:leucine-rich repeat domain-containing protein [Urbifossiella sp.]
IASCSGVSSGFEGMASLGGWDAGGFQADACAGVSVPKNPPTFELLTLLEPGLVTELEELPRKLFPPRSMKAAAALAECGEAVIPYLSYHAKLKAPEAAACVRALATIGTEQAIEALGAYRARGKKTVAYELARYVEPLSIACLQADLLQGNALPYQIRQRNCDVSPLAGLTGLQTLNLGGTRVTDMSPLAGLTGLQTLDLSSTKVSDVSPLAGLIKLRIFR